MKKVGYLTYERLLNHFLALVIGEYKEETFASMMCYMLFFLTSYK
jgi:hypothetical protein